MRLGDFVFGVLAGMVLYHLWNKRAGVNNPTAMAIESEVLSVADAVQKEGSKFSDAVKQDYDIVMPSDQIAKKVRIRAKQLTDGRYSEDLSKQTPPVSI